MAWISIPNDPVRSFTGLPLKTQKLNDNLEYVFKPIRCPSEGCKYQTVLIREWREHMAETHDGEKDPQAQAEPEMVERNVAWLILELLLVYNRKDSSESPNPLRRIQRNADSYHTSELWRRCWNSRDRQEIKLKKEQYEWLHQFLDRKLPLSADAKEARERKEQGEEPQSVAMHLYGLSGESIRW